MNKAANPIETLDVYPGQALKFTDSKGIRHAILISSDDCAPDPREEYDNIARFYCWHRRYKLGDQHIFTGTVQMLEQFLRDFRLVDDKLNEQIQNGNLDVPYVINTALHDYAVIQPIWMYDHGGITISTGDRVYPYDDPWDAGQLGWAVVLKKDMEEAQIPISPDKDWRDVAKEIITDEIATYDMYLTGEIYCFEDFVADEDGEWESNDSCAGFYGTDILRNGILDHLGPDANNAVQSGQYEIVDAHRHTVSYYSFD